MMYAVVAAGFVWFGADYLKRVKSVFLRIIAFPVIAGLVLLIGMAVISGLGEAAGGRYQDFDSMIETAIIIQDDLKKDYYGGQSFDIGYIEPSLGGVARVAPKAIIAGLFRPYLWEAGSPFMLISGLENFALLLAFIIIIVRFKKFRFLKVTLGEPFVLAIFILAIIFSFTIGLTISNFGSLVRYVIPATMLMGVVLVIAFYKNENDKK